MVNFCRTSYVQNYFENEDFLRNLVYILEKFKNFMGEVLYC